MKKLIVLGAILGVWFLVAGPVGAADGTLYQQEETTNDEDPIEVDAAGHGPANPDCTNWTYQYGNATWSGVYAGGSGWLTEAESGSWDFKVEADIEMYCSETISNHNIYFHLGNIYTATASDKIAYVNGSFSSNNGQYIGLQVPGKTEADFEKSGALFTGKIIGGMQSDHDTWRPQNNQMDIEILLNQGSGWEAPGSFGAGAHGTITNAIWWLIGGGAPGTYNYQWRVRLLPGANQADGDYYIDPAIVVAPVL